MGEIKSPCYDCDWHKAGGDKNDPRCINCEKKLELIQKIGPAGIGSMDLTVEQMNDEKAPENPQTTVKNVNYKKAPESTSIPAALPAILLSETDQLLEDHIKTMCEDHGMTIEEIRAGMQGSQDPDRRLKFHSLRDRLIKSLVSDEVFGRLTQTQIGKILCMSGASVSHRMKNMGILPVNPRKRHKKTSEIKKSKTEGPVKPIKVKETPASHLVLNFTDHQETLERIRKAAKGLMREPEAQVLFWLVHSDFEKLEGR